MLFNKLSTSDVFFSVYEKLISVLFLYEIILVSLENIQIDLQDLTRGLDNSKKELAIRQTMKV